VIASVSEDDMKDKLIEGYLKDFVDAHEFTIVQSVKGVQAVAVAALEGTIVLT
jgi:hypothetical protein